MPDASDDQAPSEPVTDGDASTAMPAAGSTELLDAADWIPFTCSECPGGDAVLRAIRCGADPTVVELPPIAGGLPVRGAIFTADFVVATVRQDDLWRIYYRPYVAAGSSADWVEADLGGYLVSEPALQAPLPASTLTSPGVAKNLRRGNEVNFERDIFETQGRSIAQHWLDSAETYDWIGTPLGRVAVDVQFTNLANGGFVYYFEDEGADTVEPWYADMRGYAAPLPVLVPPVSFAGLADGRFALLRDGEVSFWREDVEIGALEYDAPIDALFSPAEGGLAFESAGDIFCVDAETLVAVNRTQSPHAERLLTRPRTEP